MSTPPHFRLNGRDVELAGSDPTESLLRWLRRQRLTGTKEGCADGDCGACTVALVSPDPAGGWCFEAVNSCLLPVGNLPGREVLTVEALAEGDVLHPVQQAMVDCAGSQCGYCTPGFVMSLFVGTHSGELGDSAIEGNLCRCTGYQPIRAAAARLQPAGADRFSALLQAPRAELSGASLEAFFNPDTLHEALALKAANPDAAWINGGTDLGVEFSHGRARAPAFIALDRIAELRTIAVDEHTVRIGAGVPLSRIEDELAGVFPSIDAMLPLFAARQVRNRATIGGNLGSASPIGDLLPILLALDAQVELHGSAGMRTLPVDGFFRGYRSTARQPDELVAAVTIPRRAGRIEAFHKVAKRQTDDISIVAAAFALQLDGGRARAVRLAYGGVAAVPLRARRTEAFLEGRVLDADTVVQACALLESEFEPLSDHRASAGYRRRLCAGLFAKFAADLVAEPA